MIYDSNDIPQWDECNAKKERGDRLSALEQFILDNEPAGTDEIMFRNELLALILEVQQDDGLFEALQCCA